MQPGDRILCYVAGAARWVGVLEVTGACKIDKRTKIHGQMEFPVRIPVKVIAAVHTNQGLHRDKMLPKNPFHSKVTGAGGHKNLSRKVKRTWRGWIQGSPRAFEEEKDGKVFEKEIMKLQKNPVEAEIPDRLMKWRYMHPERRERELAEAAAEDRAKRARKRKASKKKTSKKKATKKKAAKKVTKKKAKKKAKKTAPAKKVAKKTAAKKAERTPKKKSAPEKVATTSSTKAQEAQKSILTSDESQKIIRAFETGHGGAFPAEHTKKVMAWAEKAKSSKDANFGFVMDGIVNLRLQGDKIQVLSAPKTPVVPVPAPVAEVEEVEEAVAVTEGKEAESQ
jgi:hypothetical protein